MVNPSTRLENGPEVLFSETHLAEYDRRPGLTPLERELCKKLLTKDGRYPDMVWPAGVQILWSPDDLSDLERLVRPILDVVDATDKNEFQVGVDRCRRRAVRVLLREMYFRRRSLWAWSEEEWIETLCGSKALFLKRHRIMADCRPNVMAVAYFLGNFTAFRKVGTFGIHPLACRLFGNETIDTSVERVLTTLQSWGYSNRDNFQIARTTICEALIAVRSSHLKDITLDVLAEIRSRTSEKSKSTGGYVHTYALAISKALVGLGLLKESLTDDLHFNKPRPDIASISVHPDWASWCKRWRETSALQRPARKTVYYGLLIAGRWLLKQHPEISSPAEWTRELAAEYVAAVDRALVGQWSSGVSSNKRNLGKPLRPQTKDRYLSSMRTFFNDCYEWEWVLRRFNPQIALGTPESIRKLVGRDPRVIDDDIWAKLLCAGLSLTEDDLPKPSAASRVSGRRYYYPLELIRALVIVWLFAGLRSDEIRRLRLGCIRWQRGYSESGEIMPESMICLLQVPAGKTAAEFVKPVDRVIGETIEAWERVRTDTPRMADLKTSERVSYLFAHRTKPVGKNYLNDIIIPMLCRKAGVPEEDARGDITSHRARSTIATQLSSSMTLLQLMDWLGHANPETTLRYVQTPVLKLTSAYKNSDYLGRNIRTAKIKQESAGIAEGGVTGEGDTHAAASLTSVATKMEGSKRELLRLQELFRSDKQRQKAIGKAIRMIERVCTELVKVDAKDSLSDDGSGPQGKVGAGKKRELAWG